MVVVPAVDLRKGCCVRLSRGEPGSEVRYGEDPVEMAKYWEAQGAVRLHVVDLDAAFGEARQIDLIAAIIGAAGIPVQVGGGIRSFEDFRELAAMGADRIVFGTVAVEEPDVVLSSLDEAPEKVVVGIDVKHGGVAVRGWRASSKESPIEFGCRWVERGVRRFVHTEVSRDGSLDGPAADAIAELAEATGVPIVASGGVGSLEHLELLKPLEELGVDEVIVGKALYEKAFTVAEASRVLGRR
jgi:phosphoribosylformimino-5-aminoimidazole carboxamide ribotide isomerase